MADVLRAFGRCIGTGLCDFASCIAEGLRDFGHDIAQPFKDSACLRAERRRMERGE